MIVARAHQWGPFTPTLAHLGSWEINLEVLTGSIHRDFTVAWKMQLHFTLTLNTLCTMGRLIVVLMYKD